jgi:hypothetical protein
MRKLTLALSAASLAIAGTAFAQAPAAPDGAGADHPHAWHREPMTRTDAQARADKLFARLDANGDGKIDAADRTARRDQRRDERFARLDADNNGAISRDEFAAAGDKARERFAEHAKGPEGQDGHKFGGHGFGGQRVAWGGHRGMRGHHGGHGFGEGLAMAGKKADTDNDGAISKAEFETAALAMFDRADANHDGTVTPEERQQLHGAHRDWQRHEPAAATG